MKKPKVALYDNDGMMTRSRRFSEVYAEEFNLDIAVMDPFFAGPYEQCLIGKADLREELEKVLGIWKWKGTADELMQYWFTIGDTIDQEVYVSIAKLKAQGLRVCLATNQEKYRMQHFITKYSYDTLFDELLYASKLGAFKHKTEGLEKILQILKEKYGVSDRGEIMYWDDREKNVEFIGSMGFNAQLYRDYPSFKTTLSEYGYQL